MHAFINAQCMTMVSNVTTNPRREQEKPDKSRSMHRLLNPVIKDFSSILACVLVFLQQSIACRCQSGMMKEWSGQGVGYQN